jgi:hypothetical protein
MTTIAFIAPRSDARPTSDPRDNQQRRGESRDDFGLITQCFLAGRTDGVAAVCDVSYFQE